MIVINDIRPIDDKIQLVLFTLSYKDVEYKWLANTPVLTRDDLQAWLDAGENTYRVQTLKQLYPQSKEHGYSHYLDNTNTELEAVEEWIEDGCMLRDSKTGAFTGNVEKVPWKGAHPVKTDLLDREKFSSETKQQHTDALKLPTDTDTERITSLKARVQVLNDIVFGRST